MMEKYYHCFMGNGEDAVLIGYTGSMVKERICGLDRGYWYKADRYYPEMKLPRPVPSRCPNGDVFIQTPETPWMELAPLCHTWYEIFDENRKLGVVESNQSFHPETGWLESIVNYGEVTAHVYTFLLKDKPLLVEHYEFDKPVKFAAFMGSGVWEKDIFEDSPFDELKIIKERIPALQYRLGKYKGIQKMWVDKGATYSIDNGIIKAEAECSEITKYIVVADSKEEVPLKLVQDIYDSTKGKGWKVLFEENKRDIKQAQKKPEIKIPDEELQKFYDFSYYLFGAMQNRYSGGIPVNNLRLTWSSHVFWDSYFVQRAMLQAGDFNRALEGCRFFQRTVKGAKKHAQNDFNAKGIKWDWEVTHEGLPAYGTWIHQKEQVHNNASYSNMMWNYYSFTNDIGFLKEFYPIIKGIAEFFLDAVIEIVDGHVEIKSLVGISESKERVKNEAANLSATIRILLNAANASKALGIDRDFQEKCINFAEGLTATLDKLYNGEFIQYAEGEKWKNESSDFPIYPMNIIDPLDERAIKTTEHNVNLVEKGLSTDKNVSYLFPWSLGQLATILSYERNPKAWEVLKLTKTAISIFGGMSEKAFYDGTWNMMYFGTAHGAVCSGINDMLLSQYKDVVYIFNDIPEDWGNVSFKNIYLPGICVSAEKKGKVINVEVVNYSDSTIARKIDIFGNEKEITLKPFEKFVCEVTKDKRKKVNV